MGFFKNLKLRNLNKQKVRMHKKIVDLSSKIDTIEKKVKGLEFEFGHDKEIQLLNIKKKKLEEELKTMGERFKIIDGAIVDTMKDKKEVLQSKQPIKEINDNAIQKATEQLKTERVIPKAPVEEPTAEEIEEYQMGLPPMQKANQPLYQSNHLQEERRRMQEEEQQRLELEELEAIQEEREQHLLEEQYRQQQFAIAQEETKRMLEQQYRQQPMYMQTQTRPIYKEQSEPIKISLYLSNGTVIPLLTDESRVESVVDTLNQSMAEGRIFVVGNKRINGQHIIYYE